jgi:plastocyanin
MNTPSGSALQKVNFVLLLVIASAVAYLIIRDRQRSAAETSPVASTTTTGADDAPREGFNPAEMKASFAPLRHRAMTNESRSGRPQPVLESRRAEAGAAGVPPVSAISHAAPLPPAGAAIPVAYTSGRTASAASVITGRVTLRGNPPPEKPIRLDPACARLQPKPMTTRHFLVGEDGGLGDVLVYIKKGAPTNDPFGGERPVLEMAGCQFQPYVLGVRAGQAVTFRNTDAMLYNVHVTPKAAGNREWNISFPARGMSAERKFDVPELFIRVKSQVHPWMFAYVSVLEHHWFAVTDANGWFALPPGLPPGRYVVAAHHLKAGEQTMEAVVSEANEPVTLRFTLDVPAAMASR